MQQSSVFSTACPRNPADQKSASNSRLIPPRGATRIVARERLISQLLDARRKRCIVVQGPAGSGKTTTFVALREALLPLGFDIAWVTFPPVADAADSTPCVDYLVTSLAQVDESICREAALLGGRGTDDEAVERTVIALVNGIANHPADVVLVLDDVHRLIDARDYEALQWLLDYAPPNLHIALLSRTILPLALGRLRDQGLVLELDMRDLRFTEQESEVFLKAQIGEISTAEARRLHELADGWAAGLQLFAIRARLKKKSGCDGSPQELASPMQLHDPQAFADYFDREVLARLDAREVELLLRMAACTQVCAPLCVALFANEQAAADVLALLSRFEIDNLFVAPVDAASGADAWYRLNPLFRDTLLGRFRTRDVRHQREVHLKAWVWFRDHGHADEAVHHALLAGEPSAAADLVLQVARPLQVKGDLRRLVALMRMLPEAEIDARPGLRLWMAHLHLYARRFDACEAAVAALKRDIGGDDAGLRYRLTLLEAALATQRDDPDSAMSILPDLLHPPQHADGLTIGGRNNLLSWLYMHRGRYDDARRVQLDAPPLIVDGAPLIGTHAGMLSGRCFVGFSYALEGKFTQTERICRDVLFAAEQYGHAAADADCFASALLAEVLYEFNELDDARKLIESRADLLERVSIPDSVLRVHTVLSAVHWLAGHRLDAFACLERLDEYAQQRGLPRLVARALAERVQRHVSIGQMDAAEAALARLDALVESIPAGRPGLRGEVLLAAGHAHVGWCAAHEDFESAAVRLQPLIAHCDERGWQRHAVRLRMQAAVVAGRLERHDAARDGTLAALRRGHRLGLLRTLLDADPGAAALIRSVLAEERDEPVLAFYGARIDAAARTAVPNVTARAATRADVRRAEVLSERETEVVRLLSQALPNKKIARTLGLSPETVKWHLKNIYGKLGVSSRDEAVARVRDFELGCASDVAVR
ncbi:ATP-dependent transcription regulator LuxR [Caballeronia peredens]|nr:ATP-dependent transcription regulator LuxR [Caballeronia peredens]